MSKDLEIKIENKKDNSLLFSLVAVLTILVAIIGAAYAYFQAVALETNAINSKAADVDLSLEVKPVAPTDSSGNVFSNMQSFNLVPLLNTRINTAAANGCKENGNMVCQIYEMKVTNNSNVTLNLYGKIVFSFTESMPHLKYSTSDNMTSGYHTDGREAKTSSTELVSERPIGANATTTLYVLVWVNETGVSQEDSGTFSATITYTSGNKKGVTSAITASTDS